MECNFCWYPENQVDSKIVRFLPRKQREKKKRKKGKFMVYWNIITWCKIKGWKLRKKKEERNGWRKEKQSLEQFINFILNFQEISYQFIASLNQKIVGRYLNCLKYKLGFGTSLCPSFAPQILAWLEPPFFSSPYSWSPVFLSMAKWTLDDFNVQ